MKIVYAALSVVYMTGAFLSALDKEVQWVIYFSACALWFMLLVLIYTVEEIKNV